MGWIPRGWFSQADAELTHEQCSVSSNQWLTVVAAVHDPAGTQIAVCKWREKRAYLLLISKNPTADQLNSFSRVAAYTRVSVFDKKAEIHKYVGWCLID
ncbi:hypothetical protein O9929_16005 [Vibrio lentus]|nr:hypothetical protein [Vibrio lentus]